MNKECNRKLDFLVLQNYTVRRLLGPLKPTLPLAQESKLKRLQQMPTQLLEYMYLEKEELIILWAPQEKSRFVFNLVFIAGCELPRIFP